MMEFARIAVAVLFNSLWEAAILAFAVWLVLRLLPNLNATTRYMAWCAALAGSLLLPLATSIPKVFVAAPHHATAVAEKTASEQTVQTKPLKANPVQAKAVPSHVAKSQPVQTQPAESQPVQNKTPLFALPGAPQFTVPSIAAYVVFGAWALAALLLLFRLGVNLRKLEHLKSDALPLPIDYREHLERWTGAEKGGRDVRLCVSEAIEVPVAVGLFDSMILIPKHLLETLTPQEMDQIMLHELGHLRRADDWTNGLQRVVQALFFFNPAVLFIAQQLDLEREVACDDWVVRETKSIRPYAHCLTKMAEVTAWPHRALAAPGVFMTRRGLSLRVERLLRAGRDVRTSLSIGATGIAAASLIALYFVLQSVAPTYAFTQSTEIPAPPPVPTAAPIATHPPVPKSVHHPVVVQHEREKIIYIERTPAPGESPNAKTKRVEKIIVIPGQHIHVPEQTIHIPAINVDTQEQRIHVPVVSPMPRYYYRMRNFSALPKNFSPLPKNFHPLPPNFNPLPPNFEQNIERQVQMSLRDGGIGGDFAGQNLVGRDFHQKKLTGADFSKANLQNANFSTSEMTGVDFSRSNLRGASFSNARMTGCDFSGSTLEGARFDGARLTGCDFSNSGLAGRTAAEVVAACKSGCDLTGANLRGQRLTALRIAGMDLTRADLNGADLSNSTFRGVDFSQANLTGVTVRGTVFENCGLDDDVAQQLISEGAKVIMRQY
ncbi:MAG TPA: pentapeptide repeat-containing protein [Candidatus Baltobacteraceae bacterium]|nr:pentapeptide repeat-containing protein [Candidatus Baltobacteraceae bacterium]